MSDIPNIMDFKKRKKEQDAVCDTSQILTCECGETLFQIELVEGSEDCDESGYNFWCAGCTGFAKLRE